MLTQNIAWQNPKSNLLDKKRYQDQHLPAFISSPGIKNQNFFCTCYFCFWSWMRGRSLRTGRNMARHWLRYNLKIFQYCLPSDLFNCLLQTVLRKKPNKPMTVVASETANQTNFWCSTTDINIVISALLHFHS